MLSGLKRRAGHANILRPEPGGPVPPQAWTSLSLAGRLIPDCIGGIAGDGVRCSLLFRAVAGRSAPAGSWRLL